MNQMTNQSIDRGEDLRSSYVNDMTKAWAKKADHDLMVAMGLIKMPPPRKLTPKEKRIKWLKAHTPKAYYRQIGERITRYLMKKFDIYEGDW